MIHEIEGPALTPADRLEEKLKIYQNKKDKNNADIPSMTEIRDRTDGWEMIGLLFIVLKSPVLCWSVLTITGTDVSPTSSLLSSFCLY